MADKYLLRVTAGPSYDPATHKTVAVNTANSVEFTSPQCTASIRVRVQDYRGLPHSSPKTNPYFTHPSHKSSKYSISFSLKPHKTVPAAELVFGNDFDYPVRDRLPPGFNTALKIVKWGIDPGLEGDAYAEKPYLYGRALGSLNLLWVGGKEGEDEASTEGGPGKNDDAGVIQEGGSGAGLAWRQEHGVPTNAEERKKWALKHDAEQAWTWEKDRLYKGDFFNGFLDFNDFSLKLPGFSLGLLGYLGGGDSLRYVLREKSSGDVWFVVVFKLVEREKAEEEEEEQRRVEEKGKVDGGKDVSGSKKSEVEKPEETFETSADDLD
ncbi:hypothetical protein MMC25_006288 [Agyrium rufum]|nr:hypothetical protein [Agyrium rufum]